MDDQRLLLIMEEQRTPRPFKVPGLCLAFIQRYRSCLLHRHRGTWNPERLNEIPLELIVNGPILVEAVRCGSWPLLLESHKPEWAQLLTLTESRADDRGHPFSFRHPNHQDDDGAADRFGTE
jgi:hypothetical protein